MRHECNRGGPAWPIGHSVNDHKPVRYEKRRKRYRPKSDDYGAGFPRETICDMFHLLNVSAPKGKTNG